MTLRDGALIARTCPVCQKELTTIITIQERYSRNRRDTPGKTIRVRIKKRGCLACGILVVIHRMNGKKRFLHLI